MNSDFTQAEAAAIFKENYPSLSNKDSLELADEFLYIVRTYEKTIVHLNDAFDKVMLRDELRGESIQRWSKIVDQQKEDIRSITAMVRNIRQNIEERKQRISEFNEEMRLLCFDMSAKMKEQLEEQNQKFAMQREKEREEERIARKKKWEEESIEEDKKWEEESIEEDKKWEEEKIAREKKWEEEKIARDEEWAANMSRNKERTALLLEIERCEEEILKIQKMGGDPTTERNESSKLLNKVIALYDAPKIISAEVQNTQNQSELSNQTTLFHRHERSEALKREPNIKHEAKKNLHNGNLDLFAAPKAIFIAGGIYAAYILLLNVCGRKPMETIHNGFCMTRFRSTAATGTIISLSCGVIAGIVNVFSAIRKGGGQSMN